MRLTLALSMLAIFTLTRAQEALPVLNLTLDKAIELALSDNPTMKVAEHEITLKEVAKKEAWQSLLPSVSIDGTVSYDIKVAEIKTSMGSFKMGMDDANTWNGGLNVSLPIYAPAIYRSIQMGKKDIELAVEKIIELEGDQKTISTTLDTIKQLMEWKTRNAEEISYGH